VSSGPGVGAVVLVGRGEQSEERADPESFLGGAAQPESRLVRYDLAERRRSVEVEALDDYAVSADGARLAYRKAESLELKPTGLDEVVSVDLEQRTPAAPPSI
jgi:hypothetical protein